MKSYTFFLAVIALAIVGCGTEASETTGPIPVTNNTKAGTLPTLMSLTDTSLNGNPGTNIETGVQPVSTLPASTSTAGLNPPHGQPGHRCDIQVGQPLNSAPAQPNVQAQPQQISTTPQPLSAPTAAGLNPAHGQPGHRCDIAVGAPLK